jgi:hypothetical protein
MQTIPIEGLGDVPITEEELLTLTPEQFMQKLVREAADIYEKNDVELDPFTSQFSREVTSSIRGAQELVTGERTTDRLSDFFSEVALEKDPVRAYSGMIAGALADPVTIPFIFGKVLKLGRLGQMALAGGTAGAIQPVREEYGEDRLFNTGVGAIATPILGGIALKVAQKLGYKTPEELQAAYDKASAEEKAQIEAEANRVAQEQTTQEEIDALQRIGENSRRAQADASRTAEQEAELARIRGIGDEAEAARKAEQDAELERIRNIGKEAELERIRQVGEDFDPNADIKKQIADMEEEVAALPSSAKQARFTKDQPQLRSQISQLEQSIERLRKAYNKASTAKKSADKKPKMAAIEAQLSKAQARLAQRQGELKFVEAQPERFKELKQARKEIEQYKKDGTVPSFVKINAPATRTDVNVDEALAAKAQQLGYRAPEPQQVVPQQVASERPVQSVSEAPTAMPQATRPQAGSVSAAATDPLRVPTSAGEAATIDLRTKEARKLAEREPTPSEAKSRPEPASKREKVQREKMKASDESLATIEGKATFSRMLEEAADTEAFVRAEIDEGNYEDAAQWLSETFQKNGMLTAAENIVASRIYAVASTNLVKLQEAFRNIGKTGKVSDEVIDYLGDMQVENELIKAMDIMRNIERVDEAARKNVSAALNSYKLANALKKSQMEQLARSRVITKLYFGVEC